MDENNNWKDSFKKDIRTFLKLMWENENLIFPEDMSLDIKNDTYIFQLEINKLFSIYTEIDNDKTRGEKYFRSQILKYWHLYQLRTFVWRNRELIATEAKSIDKMSNRMIGMLDDLFWRIPELQDENADGDSSSDTNKYVNSKLRSNEFNTKLISLKKRSCHLEHTTPRILLKHWVELACLNYKNDKELLLDILQIAELNICTAILKSEKTNKKNWLKITYNENNKDFTVELNKNKGNRNSRNKETIYISLTNGKIDQQIKQWEGIGSSNYNRIMSDLLAHFRRNPFCRYDGINVMMRDGDGNFEGIGNQFNIKSVHNFEENAI